MSGQSSRALPETAEKAMTHKPEATPRVEPLQEAPSPGCYEVRDPEVPPAASLSRRAFLGQMSGMTVATLATGSTGLTMLSGTSPLAHAAEMAAGDLQNGLAPGYWRAAKTRGPWHSGGP